MLDDQARAQLLEFERSHQSDRERFLTRLEKETASRENWRMRLCSDEHWVTADGRRIRIADMTPNHARNSTKMLRRMAISLQLKLRTNEFEAPLVWMERQPVVQALIARSNEKETWRHRRQDKRDRKAWEAMKSND